MSNTLKQVFGSVWNKTFGNGRCSFQKIVGHADIKLILSKAILSERPVHVLLVGKPGCAKTMFLTEIMLHHKTSYFVVGSNTTKAGLVNQLFARRPKFLLIDELEKMSMTDQTALLHLMETGIISETKINKTRQIELTSWVFATANSCQKIIEPLLSRFVILKMPEYTIEEFTEISIIKLARENVNECTARDIAHKVWKELGSRDIRDVIKVARLASNVQEIPFVIKMLGGHNNLVRKKPY
jgi:Holliday junction DNA helicase RuvB